MDNISTTRRDTDIASNRGRFFQLFSNIAYYTVHLFLSFLSSTFSALRPFAPQILPVLICIFLIPLVIFISVYAGFVVWKNVAVGWNTPLYLQFGYVFVLPSNA